MRVRPGTIVCAVIVVIFAAIYFYANVQRPIESIPRVSDFSVYYLAAGDVAHGRSPYTDAGTFYPPLLAFLLVPLSLVDYVTARWLWFGLSHLCLIGAGGLIWRFMNYSRVGLCCIAAVWALGGAANETLRQGQIGPVLFLLLAIAYTQRGRLQGTAAGVGLALKYFPGVVLLPLLACRRWRALAASAVAALLGLGVPWFIVRAFLAGPPAPQSSHYWMGTPAMFSWSVPSVVLRILLPITRGAPFPKDWEFGNIPAELHLAPWMAWTSVATACVVFVVGIASLAIACRGKLSDRQMPWAMAGLVALTLAVAPVSWTHYQILQYPCVAMLLNAAIHRRYWWLMIATAVCFAFAYQLPQAFLIHYHTIHVVWTTASPATLYFWTTVPPFASLGIFSIALVMARRER